MCQPFHILFYNGNSLIGRLIRLMTGQIYSHCAITIDHFHTLESAWNQSCVISHFSYKKNDYDIYKLNVRLTDVQKQVIIQYIIEHINCKYDWIYIITRGLHLLFGTKIINAKDRFNCDELIYEAFKVAGICLIEDDEMLTPSTLANSKYLKQIN